MQLEEATALAIEIESDPRFAVIAVGRFELVANLLAADRGAYPWALSVVCRHAPTYSAVLRTRDAAAEFVLKAPPAESKPTRKPPRAQTVATAAAIASPASMQHPPTPATPAAEKHLQLSLF